MTVIRYPTHLLKAQAAKRPVTQARKIWKQVFSGPFQCNQTNTACIACYQFPSGIWLQSGWWRRFYNWQRGDIVKGSANFPSFQSLRERELYAIVTVLEGQIIVWKWRGYIQSSMLRHYGLTLSRTGFNFSKLKAPPGKGKSLQMGWRIAQIPSDVTGEVKKS